ncbi:MAG: bifunctional demethylmenaquinone methyltransferase/2-methoxy-6-polyprenyl-1,4-benzoquinol methylase UbiE [Prevotella sp.]|nr:bifunctional demethylmenaquinone methyltransferase/2-methoxy-6-polyprenyl-1,4-benzoquinol methylase UbiE [Candidatus Equicola stercoris]
MAKKEFVNRMFDSIAPTYDILNHLLSLDIDKSWRRKAVAEIMTDSPQMVIDLACGTGDFAIALAKSGVPHVKGFDISEEMLKIGRAKVAKTPLYDHTLTLELGDSEDLPLADNSADAVSVAFGIRNFEHKEKGLEEMYRILRSGGKLCVLELSIPSNPIIRSLYKIYFLHILPFFGGLISGNREAYRYLPISVINFPKPPIFLQMMKNAGFTNTKSLSFTFGLCQLYIGRKP